MTKVNINLRKSLLSEEFIKQARLFMVQWKNAGGTKTKNIKKQPWSNVECFAFGGGIVRFASLETSFHAANHTIPPLPSYEGLPR